ncbi:MAG: helix-turn-helix domain-containing protein [Clostridia bacterium]|nr:helix-turn-helix domain-containing protein [Clostridia bacterium]
MDVGKRIREIRLSKGMSMKDLEKRTGVCKDTLHRIETGTTKKLRPATLQRIAEGLQVPVTDITFVAEDKAVERFAKFLYKRLAEEVDNEVALRAEFESAYADYKEPDYGD